MIEQEQAATTDYSPQEKPDVIHGISFRALLISVVFTALGLWWTRQAEIVSQATQITESVPAIPAVTGLLVLALLVPVLRRLSQRFRLSRADIFLVYVFLSVATPMASVGVVRLFFPCLTTVFYFATPENDFAKLQQFVPGWAVPHDPELLRQMFEGAPNEQVPWHQWLVPLVIWSVFIMAFFVTMLCAISLLRRQWNDKERLTYPIVFMVTSMAPDPGRRLVSAFFRSPLMWAGFSIAAIYNLFNILNAFSPSVPALGRAYDLGALFTERPWSGIRPLTIHYRPEVLGLAYLVSLDVSLSVWLFYLLARIENVIALSLGYEVAGMPFDQEQSVGAYLALTFFLIWVARHHIRDAFRTAFGSQRPYDDSDEALPYRWAFIGTIGGFVFLVGFCVYTGMALWTAVVYLFLVLGFAVVYARIRAEAGAPMVWLFPFYEHKRMMINAIGSRPFAPGGDMRNLTIFSLYMWLSRGYYQSHGASAAEGLKLSEEMHISRRSMAIILILGVLVGLLGAYYVHLQAYYQYGANVLEGGTTEGGYRTILARNDYLETASYLKAAKPPDITRTAFTGVGFAITVGLIVVRSIFLRFPLHPLGYAMVMAYGSPLWGMFLWVWIVKSIILKVGGMSLYKQVIPFFLGIVIGHFVVAGVIWSFISLSGEVFRRYVVHFG